MSPVSAALPPKSLKNLRCNSVQDHDTVICPDLSISELTQFINTVLCVAKVDDLESVEENVKDSLDSDNEEVPLVINTEDINNEDDLDQKLKSEDKACVEENKFLGEYLSCKAINECSNNNSNESNNQNCTKSSIKSSKKRKLNSDEINLSKTRSFKKKFKEKFSTLAEEKSLRNVTPEKVKMKKRTDSTQGKK